VTRFLVDTNVISATASATDALQLAAALVAAERRPASLELLTLDDRLAEGFTVINIL
jgi:hypothetical protein